MKKKIKKEKLLKWTIVMVIFTTMIISSTVATAYTKSPMNSKKIEPKNEPISSTILEQGFEEGIMPPTGWTTIDYHPSINWFVFDGEDYVHSGVWAAVIYPDNEPHDDWLISPEIHLSEEYDWANLSFWVRSRTLISGNNLELHIQGDGINDVIWDMIADENWDTYEYRKLTFDLTSYCGESITIAWQYSGQSGESVALDDITVEAGTNIPPPILEIGEITGGWAGIGNGSMVSAEIKNVAEEEGADDATDVQWCISVTGNGVIQKINASCDDTIPLIAPGGLESVELEVGRGFGLVNITVTAYEPLYDLFVSKSVNGFLFLFFVIVPAN